MLSFLDPCLLFLDGTGERLSFRYSLMMHPEQLLDSTRKYAILQSQVVWIVMVAIMKTFT